MTARLPKAAMWISLALLACTGVAVCGQKQPTAEPKPPTISVTLDALLNVREKQITSAAEAMPEDKYSFVPEGDYFHGSRTFALEVTHVAAANFAFFSEILGQPPPPDGSFSGTMNGPKDLQTKEQILKYLKDSFALGHRAIASITGKNALTPIHDPNLPISQPYLTTRLALASLACMHISNHYGQVVVYLRMNGVTPPSSVGQPPANPPS